MADLRFALRSILRHPGHSIVAIATLGLAIAAATAMFTVLNAVVLRPLPYPESERLVLVRDQWLPRFNEFSVSPGRALAWQTGNRTFEGLAATKSLDANLTGVGDPVRVRVALVNPNFFAVIGGSALAGRVFSTGETADDVVVLSEGLWRSRFGAAMDTVGRTVQLGGRPVKVIGIMPATFTLPGSTFQAWMIWEFEPQERTRYGSHYASMFGRLKKGVTIEQAREDLARLNKELEARIPDGNSGWTNLAFPLLEYSVRDVRRGILVLTFAVGGILLIACANVANLLFARGLSRSREFALRSALGANRSTLVRQLIAENLVIGLAGSLAGIGLGWLMLKGILAWAPTTLPRTAFISMDTTTLSLALALAVLTPLIFGLLPAWQMSRADLQSLVAAGGRSGGTTLSARTRAALIVVEVTLSVMLVASSMLLIRSFERLVSVNPGFNPANAITASVSLPAAKYLDETSRAPFFARVVERLAAMPGVEAAAATQSFPMAGDFVTGFEIDTPVPDGVSGPSTNFYAVTPNYFRAAGIQLLKGRDFTASDTPASPMVAVISKSIADRYLPGQDPIGHRIRVGQGMRNEFAEIVGVAGDIKQYGLDRETSMQVYQPSLQHPYFGTMTLVARTQAGPDAAAASMRAALKELDPDLPVANVRAVQAIVDTTTGPRRFTAMLLGVFSATALLLAAIGLYGLVSFTVGQQTKEIGIRMALGAQGGAVARRVLGYGLGLTLVGVVLGVGASFWTTKLLKAELFEINVHDPVAFAVAPAVLLIASALACALPVRRALKVDPVHALRQ